MEAYAKMTKLVWSGNWKLLLVLCSLLGENDHAKQASDQKLEAGGKRCSLHTSSLGHLPLNLQGGKFPTRMSHVHRSGYGTLP
jgi:hypothetical protein